MPDARIAKQCCTVSRQHCVGTTGRSQFARASGVSGSSAGAERPALTLATCVSPVGVVRTRADIFRSFPDFHVGPSWFVIQTSTGRQITKIRSIMGSAMKAECIQRGMSCSLLVNIKGRFDAAESACILWGIVGVAMSSAEHKAASIRQPTHGRGRWNEV